MTMRKVRRLVTKKYIWMPIVGVFVLILAVQLVWPSSYSRPLTSWADLSVSLSRTDAIVQTCETQVDDKEVSLKSKGSEVLHIVKPADVGASFDCKALAGRLTSYPYTSRLVPFSLFKRLADRGPQLRVERIDKTDPALESLSSNLAVAPHNAEVEINAGVVGVSKEVAGSTFDVDQTVTQLERVTWPQSGSSRMTGKRVTAAVTGKDLQPVVDSLEGILSSGMKLQYKDKSTTVDRSILGSWMSVSINDKNQPEVTYHTESIQKYLVDNTKTLKGALAMPSLDAVVSSKIITSSLEKSEPQATMSLIVVGSKSPISATPESIKQYVSELEGRGESVALFVKKIGGGTQYGANAERVYTSASTYKLFVAYSIMKRIDAGELSWSSPIIGTTTEACFERMIVVSDNACPEAFLAQYGFGAVQAEARAIGASQASFSPGNMRISAQSLAVLLEKLDNGSLVSADSRGRLFGLMRRQVYRRGIPAGTTYQVADKVGFLYALLHDASIVETPQGSYVVVIMTDNSSWGRIAELTRMIASTL